MQKIYTIKLQCIKSYIYNYILKKYKNSASEFDVL